jgi:glyoxylase-like metal-dependent hydrolase (beta-lactamase superfamily II)
LTERKAVTIGDFRCFPLSDGSMIYSQGAVFPGRSKGELADAFASTSVPSELTIEYSGLLVDTGSRRILIDTGAGSLGPTTGHLHEKVAACGFASEQIDLIILSHMHPDHIGGLTTPEKALCFPNAEVVVSQKEYEFWTAPENQSKLDSKTLLGLGEMEHVMISAIRDNVVPLAAMGRLRFTADEDELAPGIQVLPAPGHTPGHLAVLISSGRQQLLFAGDAITHPAHVSHPDWKTVFDVSPAEAIATRWQILDRSASDRCLTFHFHFPFPCLGIISRSNDGFNWESVEL